MHVKITWARRVTIVAYLISFLRIGLQTKIKIWSMIIFAVRQMVFILKGVRELSTLWKLRGKFCVYKKEIVPNPIIKLYSLE